MRNEIEPLDIATICRHWQSANRIPKATK